MRTIKASELVNIDTFKTSQKAKRELVVKAIEVVDESWNAPLEHVGKIIVWTWQTGCKQFMFSPETELVLIHRI